MSVQLYNTLTRTKEPLELEPTKAGEREADGIRMYVCGPTTYNYIHLGNARALVVFDTIRRYLEYRGYRVTFVQNFTDIDDKIINRAREEGVEPSKLAQRYIHEYFRDAEALNVRRADFHPRVSENLDDIIEMIRVLIKKGYAYQVDGDVYFRVDSFPGYGKLSGRSPQEMLAGARVEPDPRKENPLDFALWKASRAGEPAWNSPWGPGRPGWHIECSTMATKYLGLPLDIHGGGADLIFPHHENEIAQTEAATGTTFARYWVHNGFVTVNEEKMSKSLGNFFLVREILERFPGPVVRFFLLSTHYRNPVDFDFDKLAAAEKGYERLQGTLSLLAEVEAEDQGPNQGRIKSAPTGGGTTAGDMGSLASLTERCRVEFEKAMDDDFNTALAIAALFDFSRGVNSIVTKAKAEEIRAMAGQLRQARQLLLQLGEGVLGLFPQQAADAPAMRVAETSGHLAGALIDLLLEVRQRAREKKDWAMADYIRDRLRELNIVVEDTPRGPRWREEQ